MVAVIQRCRCAAVTINDEVVSEISAGLLVLLGIEQADDQTDVNWLSRKVAQMRIFDDEDGVMNLSCLDTGGEVLVVSQFTLHASTKKGNRPSYVKAAKPEQAVPLYELFINQLSDHLGKAVQSGSFGANMQVSLVNDGPVTIIVDTKDKK
jgi:D-tyrosyl-tRNA(Tyr) deacylase